MCIRDRLRRPVGRAGGGLPRARVLALLGRTGSHALVRLRVVQARPLDRPRWRRSIMAGPRAAVLQKH
eukprot:11574355-Alexandrium_andersonii.AAC.1